ncbi:MAG: hypothetical protein JWL77_6233 [Chthonomonadaceae bacterium]|nr:hypothetical protein [Chthonomonadaceae bacterium]
MRPQSAPQDDASTVCPVCTLVQRSVERQIRAFFTEFVNDPAARTRFRQSRGFCTHHTPLILELGDALAISILYADLAERTQDRWQTGRKWRFFTGERMGGQPWSPCHACAAEMEAGERYTQALAAGLERPEVWVSVEAEERLCLDHVVGILSAAKPAAAKRFQELEAGRLARLQAELEEFIRKNDYRFRGEAWGTERDAWQRALLKLSRPRG